MTRTLVSALVFVFSFSVLLVLTQDKQIHPGASLNPFRSHERIRGTLPSGVESIFVKTKDAKSVEAWRLAGTAGVRPEKLVAIIAHGNGGDVSAFFDYQTWLQSLGVTSYGFDYRGYGLSSGWPSETGIYADITAVFDYAASRENVSPDQIIVVGISLGTGPASWLAKEREAKLLILFAPYESLSSRVQELPLSGYFYHFLWYTFPTAEYVGQLSKTCLIIAHGEKDVVIPFHHGQRVRDAYKGACGAHFIRTPDAGHNDLFYVLKDDLTESVNELLKQPANPH